MHISQNAKCNRAEMERRKVESILVYPRDHMDQNYMLRMGIGRWSEQARERDDGRLAHSHNGLNVIMPR